MGVASGLPSSIGELGGLDHCDVCVAFVVAFLEGTVFLLGGPTMSTGNPA
jgi:hypothetical protein